MAYYLQMDGVDDKVATPSMTMTEVILEFVVETRVANHKIWGTPFSADYLSWNGTVDLWAGTVSAVYLDGVAQTNSTVFIPLNTKVTARIALSAAKTATQHVFSTNQTSGYVKGKLYNIKFYNGVTLMAHYDLTLGNAQDQSGNARHATLTGGTFVDDGVSSGTAYTASLSDAIATSDTLSKWFSIAVIDVVNTSETEFERATKALADALTTSDSFTSKRGKAISVSDSVAITDTIRKALTIVKTDAVNTAETERESTTRKLTDILSPVDAINVTGGKAVILADNFTVSDTVRKALSKTAVESLGVADNVSRNVSARVYDVILTTETFTKQLPNAPTIIGTVTLAGSRELNVYLLGSRVVDVTLRGEV
jgi:hypothetical protein